MERKGAEQVMWLVVAGVILLIVAAIVTVVTGGNLLDLDRFVGENTHSSTINLCETKIQNYCDREGSDDWGARYPECIEHAEAITGGSTTCQ